MNDWIKAAQTAFSNDFTLAGLRMLILLWAAFIVLLAFSVDNKWLLAGLLAYELLP